MEGEGDPLSVNKNPRIIKGKFSILRIAFVVVVSLVRLHKV
jgi:hypothetical protein